jgi:hypothetical protein
MNYGCGGSISEFVQHTPEWKAASESMLRGMAIDWDTVMQACAVLDNAATLHASVKTIVRQCSNYPTFLDAYRANAIVMDADKDKAVPRINPLTMGEYAPFVLDSSMGITEFRAAVKLLYTDNWFAYHPTAAGVVLFDLVCIHATFDQAEAFATLFALSPFTVSGATKTQEDADREMGEALALAPDETAIVVVAESPQSGIQNMLGDNIPIAFTLNGEFDPLNRISLVGIGRVQLMHDVSTDLQLVIANRPRHISWSTRLVAATFLLDETVGIVIGVHWKHDANLENYERDIVAMLRWARINHNVALFICSGDFNIQSCQDLTRLQGWLKASNIVVHPALDTTIKTRSFFQGQPLKANVPNSKPSLFECRWGVQPHSHRVITGSAGSKATPNTRWMFDHGAIETVTAFP